MSGNIPNSSQEGVSALLDEIGEVKQVVREASQQLLRIERRVKAAFPNVTAARATSSSHKGRLDEEAARRLIGSLKEKASRGEQIERDLRDYSVKPDLQAVAKILGMTNTKLPPKDELVRRISTRLRQSVSVMSGIRDESATSTTDLKK